MTRFEMNRDMKRLSLLTGLFGLFLILAAMSSCTSAPRHALDYCDATYRNHSSLYMNKENVMCGRKFVIPERK